MEVASETVDGGDGLEVIRQRLITRAGRVAHISPAELVNEFDEADERGVFVEGTLSHLEREVCSGTNDAEFRGLGDHQRETGTRNGDE